MYSCIDLCTGGQLFRDSQARRASGSRLLPYLRSRHPVSYTQSDIPAFLTTKRGEWRYEKEQSGTVIVLIFLSGHRRYKADGSPTLGRNSPGGT